MMHQLRHCGLVATLFLLVSCGGNGPETSQTSLPRQHQGAAPQGASASGQYDDLVQQMYLAYYGRPADPGGLAFYSKYLASINAPNTISELSNAYEADARVKYFVDIFAESQESNELYGNSNIPVVSGIYDNLFNRYPDNAGFGFWLNAIDKKYTTRARAALTILAGAQGSDLANIKAKIQASALFSSKLVAQNDTGAYSGAQAPIITRAMLAELRANSVSSEIEAAVNRGITFLKDVSASANNNAGTSVAKITGVFQYAGVQGKPMIFLVRGVNLDHFIVMDNNQDCPVFSTKDDYTPNVVRLACTPQVAGSITLRLRLLANSSSYEVTFTNIAADPKFKPTPVTPVTPAPVTPVVPACPGLQTKVNGICTGVPFNGGVWLEQLNLGNYIENNSDTYYFGRSMTGQPIPSFYPVLLNELGETVDLRVCYAYSTYSGEANYMGGPFDCTDLSNVQNHAKLPVKNPLQYAHGNFTVYARRLLTVDPSSTYYKIAEYRAGDFGFTPQVKPTDPCGIAGAIRKSDTCKLFNNPPVVAPTTPAAPPTSPPSQGVGNALKCISTSSDTRGSYDTITFKNNCSEKVFVIWCGDLQYSSSTCGSQKNYFTHSVNLPTPGYTANTYLKKNGRFRYAACYGGIGFGNDKDFIGYSDGSFVCLPD